MIVYDIEKYADEDELNGTCFKKIEGVKNEQQKSGSTD
jgi:hypothetical protein